MGKKGMSADDKRATVLKLLQESKRPFTLKDIEKLASKAGVVQNTVKDVLKDLTDDVSSFPRPFMSFRQLTTKT
jgi:hypothetical protein